MAVIRYWIAHRAEIAALVEQHVVLVLVSTGFAVLVGVAIDQIDDRAADAADRGEAQLHGAGFHLDRLGTALEQLHGREQRPFRTTGAET